LTVQFNQREPTNKRLSFQFLFFVLCSEHDRELEALQAGFEQAICHLSKSKPVKQLLNK